MREDGRGRHDDGVVRAARDVQAVVAHRRRGHARDLVGARKDGAVDVVVRVVAGALEEPEALAAKHLKEDAVVGHVGEAPAVDEADVLPAAVVGRAHVRLVRRRRRKEHARDARGVVGVDDVAHRELEERADLRGHAVHIHVCQYVHLYTNIYKYICTSIYAYVIIYKYLNV